MRTTWADVLGTLLRHHDLEPEQATWAMRELMRGDASSAQIAAFLIALRAKGETAGELAEMSAALLDEAEPFDLPGPVVDLAGTGGDRSGTVNLSTLASIVVAATGAVVVKHGGRGATSAVGSADLLERLGVRIDLPPRDVVRVAREVGITFCFAPTFHPGLRYAAPVRRELGVPTVINLLAPLSSPARPTHQLVGAADRRRAPIIAEILARRGVSAMVARGGDGLDELTTTTTSQVWEVHAGVIRRDTVDPRDLGIAPADPSSLRGGDADENADAARRLLAGEKGAVRDAVLLNAAGALSTFAPTDEPLAVRLDRHLAAAATALDTGAAAAVLERWSAATDGRIRRGV